MSDNSDNGKFSRRNFIGSALTLGAGTFLFDPFRALTEGVADNIILQAHAEATGVQVSRNYVNIQMPGAPIRYQFDQWLRTSSSDPALKMMANGKLNPMTCNSFDISSTGVATPAYRTFTYRGMLLPVMWGQMVYNSKGQKRPLTDLLNHMLVVRGFGSGLDGHQFNVLMQQQPIGGVSTINALSAENSATTFDAIQWPDRGGNGTFASSKGKAQSKLGGTKPLTTLMEGFGAPTNKGVTNLKASQQSAMQLAQDRLKAYARSGNSGAVLVGKNLTNATEMMKKGVGDLDSYWNEAVPRYKAAIESSVREVNLPGISDKVLKSDESASWAMGTGDIIRISKEVDVRDAIKMAAITNLAESLALTEYILKQGLAASLDVRADGLNTLAIRSITEAAAVTRSLGNDMHATGAPMVILLMTAFYRGMSAGILELMDQLGPQLWENTVVQIQGDFGRSARSNGTGSDHGFNQMVTSAFSGAFNNGPVVVGNIALNGPNGNYDGTQGIGATISDYNQKGVPTPAMAASTVTTLLGIEHNPYANTAAPLVSLSGGQLKTNAAAKIVA